MNEKLAQIRELTEDYNAKLTASYPHLFQQGGDLFLGNRYGESNRIYLGLNPGGHWEKVDFKTDLIEKHFWDYVPSPFRYWYNCQQFIQQGRGLHDWLKPATNSMCSPWRTGDWKAFWSLSNRTGGLLAKYSREILRTLINHHRNENGVTIVVAGAAGKFFVGDTMGFNWSQHEVHQEGSGTFQWAKGVYEDMTVYQVPHWSRANGGCPACARWLSTELNLN